MFFYILIRTPSKEKERITYIPRYGMHYGIIISFTCIQMMYILQAKDRNAIHKMI